MGAFLQFGVPAIIGFATGALGSIVAPWVNWGIDKRRLRLNARRTFVADARAEIQHISEKQDVNKARFRETVLYSRLREHLSERTRSDIESERIKIQMGGRGSGTNNFLNSVLDDIVKLEKKWKLL